MLVQSTSGKSDRLGVLIVLVLAMVVLVLVLVAALVDVVVDVDVVAVGMVAMVGFYELASSELAAI